MIHPIYDPAFLDRLPRSGVPDLRTLQTSAVGLWPDLTIAYISTGWLRFANENGGGGPYAEEAALGRSLLEGIAEPLRGRFATLYARLLEAHEPESYEYECSSADTFRLFRARAYPFDGRGLLLLHDLVESRPHDPSERPCVRPEDLPLIPSNGFAVQCSSCRRMRVVGEPERWVWVPEWTERPPLQVSHGLCLPCAHRYYPFMRDEEPQG